MSHVKRSITAALLLVISATSMRAQSTPATAQAAQPPPPALEFELVEPPIYEPTWLPDVPPQNGPANVTYKSIYDRYDICGRVQRGELDELWVWTGDGDGVTKPNMWEWTSSGPGVFTDLSMQLVAPDCGRVFTTMNFSYKRTDVGLHNFGHRAEGTFGRYFPCDFMTRTWPWDANQYYSSRCPDPNYYFRDSDGFVARAGAANNNVAACGDVHFPPNITTEGDYAYSVQTARNTICSNWRQDGQATAQSIDCFAWGCNEADYVVWWLQNIPGPNNINKKRDGSSHENWWPYLFGPPTAPSATATNTPTQMPTPTLTRTATRTPQPTPTHTPTATRTPTPQPAVTATPGPTNTPTPQPAVTATPGPTNTPTPQPAATATDRPSATSPAQSTTTATRTATPTATDSADTSRARAYLPMVSDRAQSQSTGISAPAHHHARYGHSFGSNPGSDALVRRRSVAGTSQQPAVMKKKLLVVILAAYGDLPAGGRATVERLNMEYMAEVRRASTYQGYRYETRLTATFLGQDGERYVGPGCSGIATAVNAHVRISGMHTSSPPVSYRLEDVTNRGVWATPCDPTSNWKLHVRDGAGGNADLYFHPFVSAPAGTIYVVRIQYANGDVQSVSISGTAISP